MTAFKGNRNYIFVQAAIYDETALWGVQKKVILNLLTKYSPASYTPCQYKTKVIYEVYQGRGGLPSLSRTESDTTEVT